MIEQCFWILPHKLQADLALGHLTHITGPTNSLQDTVLHDSQCQTRVNIETHECSVPCILSGYKCQLGIPSARVTVIQIISVVCYHSCTIIILVPKLISGNKILCIST
jgi:hypothetical protein